MNDEARAPLLEGIDFYREGPFLVFTELYLRKRGFCCESGCRHCPWGYGRNSPASADPDVTSR